MTYRQIRKDIYTRWIREKDEEINILKDEIVKLNEMKKAKECIINALKSEIQQNETINSMSNEIRILKNQLAQQQSEMENNDRTVVPNREP